MSTSFKRGRWFCVDDDQLVAVDSAESTPTSDFIADTLTASNTGVRAGVSLTDQGATTYTSANNGQTI